MGGSCCARRATTRALLGAILAVAPGAVVLRAQGPLDGGTAPTAGEPDDPSADGRPVPPAAPGGAAPVRERRLLDRVKAIVGDRVILESSVQRQLERNVGDAPLTPEERARAEREIVRELAREEIWVQVGKRIGAENPEQTQALVDGMVRDYLDERIQEYGSFTQMDRELSAAGTSWQALVEERRATILRQSAWDIALRSRFEDGPQLLVTPREMARYYRANPEQFAALDSADLAWIAFDAGQQDAAARAAAAWRGNELAEAQDIAREFGGTAMPVRRDIRQSADDATREFMKAFVREHAVGDVSEPLAVGRNLFVLKLVRKISRPAMSFDDALTQQAIRKALVRMRLRELEDRILRWKSQSIPTAPRELFDGR
ncbi:MAG: peptidyl-prolyl cis-trans isomerase [Planctomycetes bacterium]|nr:peptidyl-prolyl cis-trans isomerase [Planctomycetota bacterium]